MKTGTNRALSTRWTYALFRCENAQVTGHWWIPDERVCMDDRNR